MMHGRDKHLLRERRAKVRQVLMDSWDPIGVRDNPEAQDEYGAYEGQLYLMLMEDRVPADFMAKWLYDLATGHMGIPPSLQLETQSRNTAAELVALRPMFEAG